MKTLRIVGLAVILLAALGSSVDTARATAPVTCWKLCSDGVYRFGQCWLSLAQCCVNNNSLCPFPYVFVDGDCTDGQNHCP